MPDQPQPTPPPPKPDEPADPAVYGGQWGDSGKAKTPGPQPTDRPKKIETPPEKN